MQCCYFNKYVNTVINMNKKLLLSLILGLCASAYAKDTKYSVTTATVSNPSSVSTVSHIRTSRVSVTAKQKQNSKQLHLMNPIKIHNDELIVPVEKLEHVINKVQKLTKTLTSNSYDNNKVDIGASNETFNDELEVEIKPISVKSINMWLEFDHENQDNNALCESIKSNNKVIDSSHSKALENLF